MPRSASATEDLELHTDVESPGFTAARLLDFNGDGKADLRIVQQEHRVGYLGIGDGTGAFTFYSVFLGPGYDTIDVLDLNGDGKIDVTIYNSQNGAAYTGISTSDPAILLRINTRYGAPTAPSQNKTTASDKIRNE